MASDDPRLGDLIKTLDLSTLSLGEETRSTLQDAVVLVGFPWDEGVRRNGGREGASEAPATVRKLMPRIGTLKNPELGISLKKLKVFDSGDIGSTDAEGRPRELEEAHRLLTERVKFIVSHGGIPFVIGGGNDQSYPNVAGLLEATEEGPYGVVNIDAHFDVRPLKEGRVHSGSPFRLMLEHPKFSSRNGKFIEFAAQGNQCSAKHAKYLKEKGCDIVWLSQLLEEGNVRKSFVQHVLDKFEGKVFVSFDLDAVASSYAPGVSCPGTIGLTSKDALDICFEAGRDTKVRLFDLSEFNPRIDSYITGRLVVNMFYFFLLGYAKRLSSRHQ
eukprot:TRINITY_DN9257_c0_g1_i1.p1 TRINITY_DN9257_c0_g1~~TRINITY_DN9257_c0_g1_i1.p1  ORF type:complete len:342 (+),score=71.65 TRINITY_DN9257_c0_g1_i1:41-1027(+)